MTIPSNFDKYKREAERLVRNQGHELGPWEDGFMFRSFCVHCGRKATVDEYGYRIRNLTDNSCDS